MAGIGIVEWMGDSRHLFRPAGCQTSAAPGNQLWRRHAPRPEWYNTLTDNCTTNIAVHVAAARGKLPRWDWRILMNGYSDQMLYERGDLAGDLPFPQLKRRA